MAKTSNWSRSPLADELVPDLERLGVRYTGSSTHAPLVVDGRVVPEIIRTLVRNLEWPATYAGGALFDGELRWLVAPERPFFLDDEIEDEGWLVIAEIDSPDGLNDALIVDLEERPEEDPELAIRRWTGNDHEMSRITLSELLARLNPFDPDALGDDADDEDDDDED